MSTNNSTLEKFDDKGFLEPNDAQKDEDKQEKKISSYKVKIKTNAVFVGKRYSGKSNLIANLVEKGDFDQVFLITGTPETHNLDFLVDEDEEFIMEDVTEEWFKELMRIVKEENLCVLLLFDDYSGDDLKGSKSFKKIVKSGRNMGAGIGILYSQQKWTDVPLFLRENVEQLYVGDILEMSIKKVIDEMASVVMPKKKLRVNLERVSNDKNHDFLYYDDKNKEWFKIHGNDVKVLVK